MNIAGSRLRLILTAGFPRQWGGDWALSQQGKEAFQMNAKKYIAILGATSAMARSAALEFAQHGYGLILCARDMEENERVASDVRVRCEVDARTLCFDAEDFSGHPAFFEKCKDVAGDALFGVVLCFGFMDSQKKAQADFSIARKIIDINFTSAVSILELFAAYFEQRREGFIVAISSIAGDKGRQSNYIYGASKSGLSAYLQGLRNRLFHAGVHVATVKPGFVDTKMTFGLPGLFLVASPESIGKAVFSAALGKKNVVYAPFFWRFVMLIFQHLPEFVFKRMKT
jgi:short-subunit dehydrogenase